MNAKTVQLELPKQVNLAGVQKRLVAGLSNLRMSGRKVLLAYVGICALTIDGAVKVYKSGVKLIDDAERRGSRMELELAQRIQGLWPQAADESSKLQNRADTNIDPVRSSALDTQDDAEKELEKRVALVLANLNIPSRDRLERLSREIEHLNQKIDQELLREAQHV